MTKAQYIKWKQSRPDNAADWSRQDCIEADALVKTVAMAELAKLTTGLPPLTKAYVCLMARAHFGSVETDQYLQALGCYPEWL